MIVVNLLRMKIDKSKERENDLSQALLKNIHINKSPDVGSTFAKLPSLGAHTWACLPGYIYGLTSAYDLERESHSFNSSLPRDHLSLHFLL